MLTLNDDVPHDRPDVRLSYIAPGAKPIQDLAGNDAADLTDEAVTNNSLDTKPPELLSAEVDGATLILTYNEDLDETSEPATSAYTVSGSHSVTGVDVVGKTVELTLNPAVTYEETGITVSYTNPGTSNNPVKDEAGNEAANLTNEPVTNNTPDTDPPLFEFATVSGATLTLAYDEELKSTSEPVASAFTVSGSNGSHPVTGVNVVGATVVLTLNPAVAFEETGVTVSYTNPGTNPIEDLAGNDADNLTNEDVANDTPDPDQTGPVLQTREVNGAALTLTYNEDLDSTSVPDGGAYTVTVNGSSVAVDNSVTVTGKVVSLTLSTAVVYGDTVTVAYVPGSNPVRDDSENENNAASFSARSVTNNTPFVDTAPPELVGASVNRATLFLTYDEGLGSSKPGPGAYTVNVNGADVQNGVSAVSSVSGHESDAGAGHGGRARRCGEDQLREAHDRLGHRGRCGLPPTPQRASTTTT